MSHVRFGMLLILVLTEEADLSFARSSAAACRTASVSPATSSKCGLRDTDTAHLRQNDVSCGQIRCIDGMDVLNSWWESAMAAYRVGAILRATVYRALRSCSSSAVR